MERRKRIGTARARAPKAVSKAGKRAGKKAAVKKAAVKSLKGDAYALRSRILGKAAEVFSKRGASATIEDILQASGVSRRTFYRFYQGKEDVLDALHEIGCNMLIGAAQQLAGMSGDPVVRLERAIEAYLDYHITVGANVMYVVQVESMRPGSKLNSRRRAFFDTMGGLFEREMHAVTGLHVDPLLLRSLFVAIEAVSLSLRVDSHTPTFDRDRAKRVILRMVMATVAAPAGGAVPDLPLVFG
jgi:AcrR family transcriptional regulator